MARPLVLVTGASRGIGRAVAQDLAADHDLLLGGRDRAALGEFAERLGGIAPVAGVFRPLVADLTDADEVARAIADADLSGLDGLVHSAGILRNAPVAEMSDTDYAESFAVNVTAVARLTRLLLPALRRARGTVVALNSGSGFTSGSGKAAYSGSKFALRAFTDALRAEEREHGVRVGSVHPGRVDAGMQHELRAIEGGAYEAEKYLRPASVAAAVRFVLTAGEEASVEELSIRPR